MYIMQIFCPINANNSYLCNIPLLLSYILHIMHTVHIPDWDSSFLGAVNYCFYRDRPSVFDILSGFPPVCS